MKPGSEIDFSKTDWRPTGSADAVFYLDARTVAEEVVTADGARVVSKTVVQPSMVESALRYLAPCSQKWHDMHPGMHGLTCCPDLRGLVSVLPAVLQDAAKEVGVQVCHQIRADSVLAENPWLVREAGKIRWEEAERGIWCAFCVE
jgi:hypothetical protein